MRRRGLDPDADGMGREDPVAETAMALAGIFDASVQGRVALGAPAGRRGAPSARRGARPAPRAPGGIRSAHQRVGGSNDRACLALKHPWSDGTTHLLFEPVEFLETLAALTPRPEINRVLYNSLTTDDEPLVGAHTTTPWSGTPSCATLRNMSLDSQGNR